MTLTSTAAKITSKGGRNYNEDSVFFMQSDQKILAIVADGLGGHGGGDLASKSAVEAASEYLFKENIITDQHILDTVNYANEAVLKHPGAKTTIALLCLDGSTAISAHVGDTRIYQFRDSRIIFQSIDHSVSQMAVAVGEINHSEIRYHPDRNKLLRALGDKESPGTETAELTVHKSDAFLLCSDGFWELIVEQEMEYDLSLSQNAKEWLYRMSERVYAKTNDKSDNYSAIAIII